MTGPCKIDIQSEPQLNVESQVFTVTADNTTHYTQGARSFHSWEALHRFVLLFDACPQPNLLVLLYHRFELQHQIQFKNLCKRWLF